MKLVVLYTQEPFFSDYFSRESCAALSLMSRSLQMQLQGLRRKKGPFALLFDHGKQGGSFCFDWGRDAGADEAWSYPPKPLEVL